MERIPPRRRGSSAPQGLPNGTPKDSFRQHLPLEKQMWGDESGMCVDPFGIQWMVDISPPTG